MPVVEAAPRGTERVIRLRPVPRCDPPYDDEHDPHVWSSPDQMALEWSRRAREAGGKEGGAPVGDAAAGAESMPAAALPAGAALPAATMPAPGLPAGAGPAPGLPAGAGPAGALLPAGAMPAGAMPAGAMPAGAMSALGLPAGVVAVAGPPPVVAGASGDARLAVRRFVSLCVEVLNGYRPANHLRRLALPKEAGRVVAQGLAGSQRVAELRRAARGTSRRSRQPGPVAVLKARLCEPRPGAVEAAVLLVTGERTWAMALRLELHHQSWCATTLHLL